MSIIYGTLERLEAEQSIPETGSGNAVSPRQVVESEGLLGSIVAVALIVVLTGTSLMLWRQAEELLGTPNATLNPPVVESTVPETSADEVWSTVGPESADTSADTVGPAGRIIAVQSAEPVVPVPPESVVVTSAPPVAEEERPPASTSVEESVAAIPETPVAVKDHQTEAQQSTVLQGDVTADERDTAILPARVDEVIDNSRSALSRGQYQQALSALEALQADPENEFRLAQMINEFEALGPNQGAVLSYAPYISSLLSDDPFENL